MAIPDSSEICVVCGIPAAENFLNCTKGDDCPWKHAKSSLSGGASRGKIKVITRQVRDPQTGEMKEVVDRIERE